MSDIKITAKAGYDIVKMAATLFFQGTGIPLQPMDDEPRELGFVDDVGDPESDMRFWANQLMFFARTVHGIMERALLEAEDDL